MAKSQEIRQEVFDYIERAKDRMREAHYDGASRDLRDAQKAIARLDLALYEESALHIAAERKDAK